MYIHLVITSAAMQHRKNETNEPICLSAFYVCGEHGRLRL